MLAWNGPEDATHLLVLAPGDEGRLEDAAPLLVAEQLGHAGIRVVRFAFPTCPTDDGAVRDALVAERIRELAAARGGARLVLGGFSRGARVSVALADELGADAVLAFAYPFHPRHSPDAEPRLRVLRRVHCPVWMVQGTRDSHGNLQQVRGYDLPSSIRVHWLEDANHALQPRVRSGHTQAQQLTIAAAEAATLILGLG